MLSGRSPLPAIEADDICGNLFVLSAAVLALDTGTPALIRRLTLEEGRLVCEQLPAPPGSYPQLLGPLHLDSANAIFAMEQSAEP